jgi:SPP1 gp7 family putative phage head morphogenesis protein
VSAEQDLADKILQHALDLQRLSAGDEAKALATLKQLEDELRALMGSKTLSAASQRELAALIAEAEKAIDARYAIVAGTVDTQRLMLVVAENTAAAMQSVLAGEIARVTAQTIASLAQAILIEGAPSAAWWAKQSEDVAFKFATAVRQGVINGETNERIVARVAGKQGFMEIARHNARSLVHSSIMTAANEARWATYSANAELADGVRWLATLDSHTCLRCGALDGAAWGFDRKPLKPSTVKFQGLPPLHWACRCVVSLIPSTSALDPEMAAEIKADQMRASKDGPVANQNFDAFLNRQSPEFIANTLGKRRAELYQAGKLTLRDLVSGTGRPLTLDELASQ